MGERGPVPARSETRIRRSKDYPETTKLAAGERTVGPWEPDERWHPIAIELWESAQNSGQSALYEETDWWQLYFVCELVSRELKPQFIGFEEGSEIDEATGEHVFFKRPLQAQVPVKGSAITAIRAMMATLLMTEGDRRRLQVELQKGPAAGEPSDHANVVSMMDAFRKKPAAGS